VSTEREVKLSVPAGFVLPGLADVDRLVAEKEKEVLTV